MTNVGAETVLDSYHTVTMPDGTPCVMVKLDDGTWDTLASRLQKAKTDASFMQQFTTFKPTEHTPHTTDVLQPLSVTPGKLTATENRLEAYLDKTLGKVDDVLNGEAYTKERIAALAKHPAIREHVVGLITVYNNPKWNAVRALLYSA